LIANYMLQARVFLQHASTSDFQCHFDSDPHAGGFTAAYWFAASTSFANPAPP
jgi:hypothetical protein